MIKELVIKTDRRNNYSGLIISKFSVPCCNLDWQSEEGQCIIEKGSDKEIFQEISANGKGFDLCKFSFPSQTSNIHLCCLPQEAALWGSFQDATEGNVGRSHSSDRNIICLKRFMQDPNLRMQFAFWPNACHLE